MNCKILWEVIPVQKRKIIAAQTITVLTIALKNRIFSCFKIHNFLIKFNNALTEKIKKL